MSEDKTMSIVFGTMSFFGIGIITLVAAVNTFNIANSPTYIRDSLKAKIEEIKVEKEIRALRKELDELQNN